MHTLIIVVAQYFIVLAVLVIPIVFFQLKEKQARYIFILSVVAGGLLALLLAHVAGGLFYNPRPFVVGKFVPLIAHSNTNGFPSDHTLLSAFIGWTLLLNFSKKYSAIVLGIAFFVGSARVLAGVHHPIDIIGGFVISFIAAIITKFIIEIIVKRQNTVDKTIPG